MTQHLSAPSPIAVTKNLKAVKSHADAAKEAIREHNLVLANKEIDSLTEELLHTQDALTVYVRAVDVQTNFANHAIDDKNAAIIKGDKAERRYHRLKFPVCLAGAAIVTLLVLRFRLLRFIPPPYDLVGVVALPTVIFSALWLLL